MQNSNPFFSPYEYIPFGNISEENIREAIIVGIQQAEAEVDAIVANTEPPTFENTIVALEGVGDLLERATTVMYNLHSACTTDALDALATEMAPLLSEHSNNITMNETLYLRCKEAKPEVNAPSEDWRLYESTLEGFERSGVTLSPDKREEYREISKELSRLSLQFSENVRKATNAFELFVTDEAQLKGIPAFRKKEAEDEARQKGKENGWLFTLQAPSYVPFMTYSENASLREMMYRAYNTKCTDGEYCNFDIVCQLVELRRRKAQLLGYDCYADYVLRRRMAENKENVYELLNNLLEHYTEAGKKDVARVGAKNPWDFSFMSHKLQLKEYNLDAEMLRPYFKLENVIKGVFGLATRLYGIKFIQTDVPVYHPDVKAFQVQDADGSNLALLYTDFFPRANKQGGAWMTEYRGQQGDVRPQVSVVMNFSKPTADTPSLLTLSEVETFLHEFGHALHGMFSKVRHRSQAGTNVYWDFVELPSQFMENFAVEKEFLKTFAFHYQTGEVIPDELINRIHHSRTFNAAYACMRQVSFGLLDMAYYTLTEPLSHDIRAFEQKAWAPAQLLPSVDGACMTVQFGHIMAGGYSAGYYSYKWAEVLDADAFSVFQKEGIFNPSTANRFRTEILSKGNSDNPMTLYINFRGCKPTINALLKRDGIK